MMVVPAFSFAIMAMFASAISAQVKKPQGNVVIASGTTNVIYKDFVILDSGFEVKLGSEFNVTPRN